jgi:hypothetical protein
VAVWADLASTPVLYAAFFLFATGETLADSASVALLPSIVPAERLADANARLLGSYLVGNQLLAPPVGAWLFVMAAALPFAFDAASFLTAALLLAPLLRRPGRVPQPQQPRSLGPRSPRGWAGCGATARCGCWPSASGS